LVRATWTRYQSGGAWRTVISRSALI